MCKLFIKHEKEIKDYFNANNLNFEVAKKMPKSVIDGDIYLQYYDEKKGQDGLLDETPMPVVLKICIDRSGNVTFENTENTIKYLMN